MAVVAWVLNVGLSGFWKGGEVLGCLARWTVTRSLEVFMGLWLVQRPKGGAKLVWAFNARS